MIALEIPVWQFVRIMVQLEGQKGGKSKTVAQLYDDWLSTWKPLDKELAALADENFAAYSDLMMENQVNVTLRDSGQQKAVCATIERVVQLITKKLDRERQNSDSDPEIRKGLDFEISELQLLLGELQIMKHQAHSQK